MSVNNVQSPMLKAFLDGTMQPSITQAPIAQALPEAQSAPIASKADEFVKKGNSTKKILIGTGIALAITGLALAFLGRKNITKTGNEVLEKITKIDLPVDGYDLSKESKAVGCFTNNPGSGFVSRFADENGKIAEGLNDIVDEGHKTKSSLTKKIMDMRGFGVAGKTAEGVPYVKFNSNSRFAQMPEYRNGADILAGTCLLSDGKNFTPAQKNILALIHQGNFHPPEIVDPEKLTRQGLFEIIAKAAKNIDTENQETIDFINQITKLKNGTCFRPTIEGLQKTAIKI